MAHHRRALALVVSLAVHAAVVVSVARVPTTPLPTAPPAPTPLTWLEVESPPEPKPPTPRPRPVRPTRARPPAPAAQVVAPSPQEPTAPVPLASEHDAPRALFTLLPGNFGLPGPEPEAPRGLTIHPGDGPSDRELKEEETARVTARVDGFLRHGLARAHVANGLVDPAFDDLRHRLVDATKEVPDLIGLDDPKKIGRAVAQSWLAGAERYGRTGQAYDAPEGYREAMEHPSALVEGVARGSPDAIKLQQFLSAGARLQEFADGRSGVELVTLVEVFASPEGALQSLSITQSSGVKAFDDFVLGSAKTVTGSFSLDGGVRTRPMRSVWRFGGVVTFRRSVKSVKDLEPWSMLGSAALSMLTGGLMPSGGRFDEVTGAVDVIDLTHHDHQQCL